jgi:mRNA interferase MazF
LEPSIKRGDIFFADLSPVVGSEQGGVRPVLIVQNDVGNRYSPTVIAAAITSQINKARLPTHIELSARSYGLTRDSVILLEQIRTIDKTRLKEKMGKLDEGVMNGWDEALAVSFGLEERELTRPSPRYIGGVQNGKKEMDCRHKPLLLVLLLLVSYMAVYAESSSEDDPLVALSYLTDVLAPETIEKVNAAIELKADEMLTSMNQTLTEYTTQLDAKISEFESRNENIATDESFISAVTTSVLAQLSGNGSGTTGGVSGGWELVQVTAGQTYSFKTGGMILLRIGNATCYTPSSPGIIDVTSGTELEGGGALEKNHLYMVTVDGRGFYVTSDTTKIMVYGDYTIS